MRVVADFSSRKILQVEKTPEVGVSKPFNGRFSLPVPDGASVDVDSTTYILPQDGGDLATDLAAALLARYPMYSNVAYNFFLEATDVADIDFAGTGPSGEISRFQTGRAVGPAPTGCLPNMTAILGQNGLATGGARPGCLVTDTIDITAATLGAGADEVLVWWHIYSFDNTEDVASSYGATNGQNTPGYKMVTETDQEPAGLDVYVSNDDGVTWHGPIGRLEPTDLLVFDTSIRLAFLNTATNKVYLAAYAVLF